MELIGDRYKGVRVVCVGNAGNVSLIKSSKCAGTHRIVDVEVFRKDRTAWAKELPRNS